MSKGGGGGAASGGSQMQQTQLPEWVNNGAMQNWSMAKEASQGLMEPYSGNRVAGMPAGMAQLIDLLQANAGTRTDAGFNSAQATTQALSGYTPTTVTPQMLRDTNLQPYMNPYTQSVIDPSLTILDQSLAGQNNAAAASASQTGAFGGSRQGIVEAVNNAQTNLLKGQLAGNLNSQNFAQAQAAATGDISRDLGAQQFNSQQGLAGAQFRGGMANQLAGLSTQSQQNWLQSIQAAMQGQGLLQGQDQKQIDALMQQYAEQKQYPLDQLAIRQNALSNSPYGQTTYSQREAPPGDAGGQILGGLSTVAGIAGKLAPLFMMSDRSTKTDIEKIGVDGMTGLPMYAYRYKSDPKTYPKIVGPMAQDVKKKFPEAVREVGGKLAINLNMLGMAA